MADTRFVVSRYNWRPHGRGHWLLSPGTFRLLSFDTRPEAEAELARREANARQRVNPFRCGKPLADLTSIPEPLFLDWVRDRDLTPPEPGKDGTRDWAGWWDAGDFTASQREGVWEGLNRLKFFELTERPNVPVGYAVVNVCWQYNDEYNYTEGEGGEVMAIYRSRERAIEAGYKRRGGGDGAFRWNAVRGRPVRRRRDVGTDRGRGAAVRRDRDRIGGRRMSLDRMLYLLARRVMFTDSGEWVVCHDEVHPVAAFASKADADAARAARESEFRHAHDVWVIFYNRFSDRECASVRDTAMRLGLLATSYSGNGWKCWESFTAPPTEEQRVAFWDAVPDCKIHRIVETTLKD